MSDAQNPPRVTVSNYTKIWNLDWVIYALEGKKLPIPANLRVVAIFISCEVFWIAIGKILFFIPNSYTYLLLPGASAWLIAKQKLDGKAPHKWLWGMILFWIRPKHLHRYRRMEHNGKYKFGSKVVYRTTRERA